MAEQVHIKLDINLKTGHTPKVEHRMEPRQRGGIFGNLVSKAMLVSKRKSLLFWLTIALGGLCIEGCIFPKGGDGYNSPNHRDGGNGGHGTHTTVIDYRRPAF